MFQKFVCQLLVIHYARTLFALGWVKPFVWLYNEYNHLIPFTLSCDYKHLLFRLVSHCRIIQPCIYQEKENLKRVPCCFKWLDNTDLILIFSCSGVIEGARLAFHACRGKTIYCEMWERELSHPAASGQAFQVFSLPRQRFEEINTLALALIWAEDWINYRFTLPGCGTCIHLL